MSMIRNRERDLDPDPDPDPDPDRDGGVVIRNRERVPVGLGFRSFARSAPVGSPRLAGRTWAHKAAQR
jgi:hypothetical protein